MNQQIAIDLIRHALTMAMMICLPLLVVLFVFGVVISLLQTLTSIQDPSFGAVPRLTVLFVGCLVALPWMVSRMVNYTETLITNLVKYAR
jgi:flagellar biosynthetic protein FliQ